MRASYFVTKEPNPHIARGREILRRHPELRQYFQRDPLSTWCVSGVVLFQLGIAFLLRDAAWWWVVLAAWCIGAFASHALFVLIHDAGHDLIGRTSVANRWWGILCNVGQGLPSAMPFRTFHLLHHSHLDEYAYDGDLAFHWEARLVGDSWWRKTIWLALFSLVEVIRPLRIKKSLFNRWLLLNIAVVVATDTLIFLLCGWPGLSYVVLSTVFGLGLHPVGARWVQEHYTFVEGQETYSYYGPLNRVAFNIGYHNEHHDLPRVPWRFLPRVKAIAPEFYEPLYAHGSWTKLLLRFLFDPGVDLYARITRVRPERPANVAAAA
jgi:sphingolipid delta-4 desaturase